jgi:hypothetical protein
VSVSSSGGQLSNVYIKNDILYIPDYVLGYIYQVTTPLTSTSYPYSTTILLSGFVSPVCTIISSQGYMYILDQGNYEVHQYVSGSATNYQPIFGGGQGLAGVDNAIGLAFDSTESNIYVSDASNGQILMISVTSTPGTDGILVAVSHIAEFALTHRLIH